MFAKRQTKTADSKGRVILGVNFANRVVIIQSVDDTEVRVTLARVIPIAKHGFSKTLAQSRRFLQESKNHSTSNSSPDRIGKKPPSLQTPSMMRRGKMPSYTPKWTPTAANEFQRLMDDAHRATAKRNRKNKATRQQGLFKQVKRCIDKLLGNPKHPGLHTHKYDSLPHPWTKSESVFEAYAQNRTPSAYRVFWCYGPGNNEITIIAITPHP